MPMEKFLHSVLRGSNQIQAFGVAAWPECAVFQPTREAATFGQEPSLDIMHADVGAEKTRIHMPYPRAQPCAYRAHLLIQVSIRQVAAAVQAKQVDQREDRQDALIGPKEPCLDEDVIQLGREIDRVQANRREIFQRELAAQKVLHRQLF